MASAGVSSPGLVLVAPVVGFVVVAVFVLVGLVGLVDVAPVLGGVVVGVAVVVAVAGATGVRLDDAVAPGVDVPPQAASSSAAATTVGGNPRNLTGRLSEMPIEER